MCDASPTVQLVSISSSDPVNRRRNGDIQAVGGGPVALGTDERSFLLRAEHSGEDNGRVCSITYRATDAAGMRR